MFTVGQLKDSVAGLLQGINLDNVTNVNKALERSARTLIQKADVPEASEKQSITLYGGVHDYLADTDIFGGAVTDIRPQGASRQVNDYVYKQPIAVFDRTKALLPNGYAFTFSFNKGTPIIRIASPKPTPRVVLDPMSATTGWTAGGSIASVSQDTTVYYEQPASLRFTLTGSSTGTLTKTINQLSIASYEDVCVGFLAIRIPDGATATDLTSVAVRVGSSDSAYDEVSNTTGFLGAWVSGEFLLVALDFSSATSTGTPDWTAIDYIQIRLAHTATLTNFRVGGFWLSLPSPHEVLYQTAAIFLVSSALSKTITDDNDSIVLNDAAFLLYEHECAITIAEQGSGGDLSGIAEGYKAKLRDELYPMYKANNPSQQLREIGSWYD